MGVERNYLKTIDSREITSLLSSEGHLILDVRDNPLSVPFRWSAK